MPEHFVNGNRVFQDRKMVRTAIIDPTEDVRSLRSAVMQLKEAVEILQGRERTNDNLDAAVRWRDLVRLGLVPYSSVPKP